MEIRHLRSFVAVAEEQNFTRAARRLHLATSPLSRRIRELERELGAPLFVRGHHCVELTAAGRALLQHARDVLERCAALPEVVQAAGGTVRTARIGIASAVPSALRDTLIAALGNDVRVRLYPGPTAPLVRMLADGALDLALVHGRLCEPALAQRLVHVDALQVVVGAGAGFDGRETVRLGELAHLPLASVDWSTAPDIYRDLDRVLSAAGVLGRRTVVGDNFAGLAHLVASGEAFSFLGVASGAVAKAFAGEHVVRLAIEDAELPIATRAVWRPQRAVPGDVVADLVGALESLVSRGNRATA